MSSEMVECYSGQTYAERPRAIRWEGERLEIIEILIRWRYPGGRRFRVRVEDDQIFELSYDEISNQWQIHMS